ncbi:hypothetical protein LO771_11100 [Streptacidiphilus sp. ASG 303]|uniref:hypothetical protein n=1 Tax=Streptacidiphilus sp. ASG 303 TaxID=2896847 RepID=UPI001E571872|nr:hypothetical protein [Streptacidiphilus sp. ASG 303]MCD0482931.1 hypothetical protein [Streptacidiphilus sp. ASG 303]
MLDPRELDAESADLLPGREALTKFSLNFTKAINVTKHVAHVEAANSSQAVNQCSPGAVAQASAGQSISIKQ